ncbi:MAG: CDP-alcohol phosphatidyltransferase family protein [bacterium]
MGLNLRGNSAYFAYVPAEDPSILRSDLFRGHGRSPITKAVIIAAGNGSRLQGYQNGCPKPLLKVGGIHLLQRVILSAKKIGITEFVIVIGYQAARIRKAINSKKLGVKITWVRNVDWRKPNGLSVLKAERYVYGNFLLFMSDHIFDHKILNRIKDVDLGKDEGLLCVDYNLTRVPNLDDATKVRTENNRLINLDKSLTDFNAIDVGIFVCTPELFDALRQSQDSGDYSLSGGIRVLAQDGRMRTVDIGDCFWQDVDTIPDARYAERLLLRSTRSKDDGIIARTLNRRISNRITKWLLKTPITPNQISVLNLFFSFFVAWLVSLGKPATTILGGVLFQLASVLDGCDGEVAVIKLRDSKRGAFVDTLTDHLSYVSFIIGITVGVYHATGNPIVFYVTGFMVLGLLFALNMARIFVKKQGSASLRTLDEGIASLNHSGQKVWYLKLFGIIHHFGRRDLFSFAAMLVLLSGNLTVFYAALMLFLCIIVVGIPISVTVLLAKSNRHRLAMQGRD